MEVADWVSSAIALAALIVSIIALAKTNRAAHRQVDLQARLIDIEQARERDRRTAQLKASLVPCLVRDGNDDYLVIGNSSPAGARNIEVSLDGRPLREHPVFPSNQPLVTQVGPKGSFRYPVAITFDHAGPFHVVVTWTDDSGEPGQWESTLTL